MALQKQIVEVPFARGLAQKVSPHLVPPGGVIELENAVFNKAGAIVKRTGYDALAVDVIGTSADISAGKHLATRGTELVQVGDKSDVRSLYSWVDGASQWREIDRCSRVGVETAPVGTGNTRDHASPDVAHKSGYTLYAWENGTDGLELLVVDDNGVTVATSTPSVGANTDNQPECVAIGTKLFALWFENTKIRYSAFDTAAPANGFSTPADLVTDALTSPNREFFVYPNTGTTSNALLAYAQDDAGTSKIRIAYIDSTPTLSGAVQITQANISELRLAKPNAVAGTALLLYFANNDIFAAFIRDEGDGILTVSNGPTMLSGDLASQGLAAVWHVGQGKFYAFWSTNESVLKYRTVDGSFVFGTETTLMRGTRILGSEALFFSAASEIYLPVWHSGTLQSTGMLIEVLSKRIHAVFRYGVTGATTSHLTSLGSNKYRLAIRSKTLLEVSADARGTITGRRSVHQTWRADFDLGARSYRTAEYGGALYIAGGMVEMYDGRDVVEAPFILFPEDLTVTAATTGGFLGAGTYQVCAVYEWKDALGRRHQSAPSPAKSHTFASGTTNKLDVAIPTLRHSNIPTGVTLVLYATQADGEVFHRVAKTDDTPSGGATVTEKAVKNDTSVDTLTIIRDGSVFTDTQLGSNEILYTNGNVLENIGPRSASHIVAWKDRLVLAGLEGAPKNLWYSKHYREGVGAQFSDLLELRFAYQAAAAEPPGDITGVGVLDDSLVVFTRNRTYLVGGDGADDRGVGDFLGPSLIASDVGCSEPASIVLGGAGLYFKSPKGIYRLSRALQVEFVGAAVEDKNSQTITSGVLLPDNGRIIWTTDADVALVYDYVFDQWSVFTNHAAKAATVWKNTYCYLLSTGVVRKANSAKWQDGSTNYKRKVVTSWYPFGGHLGYQRLWRIGVLGIRRGAEVLRVQRAHDYSTSLEATAHTYDTTALATDAVVNIRIHNPKQKGQAIQLTIDEETATSGEATILEKLAFEFGVKAGMAKMPASRTI